MTFEEYQAAAAVFAVYQKAREREYLSLGLISEVGELAGKLKKEIRDGVDLTEAILDETGDCMWYIAMLTRSRIQWGIFLFPRVDTDTLYAKDYSLVVEMAEAVADVQPMPSEIRRVIYLMSVLCTNRNTTLEAVCERNIAKLQDRKNRDVIKGSGDTR